MKGMKGILWFLPLLAGSVTGMHVPSSKLLSSIGSTYIRSLNQNPFTTNVVTAAGLCVLSDSISQLVERRAVATAAQLKAGTVPSSSSAMSSTPASLSSSSPAVAAHNWYRSFCMFLYGGSIYGVMVIYWFRWLNTVVPQEGITPLLALKKVFINQAVMSPLLNSLFFGWVSYTRDISRSWNFTDRTQQLKKKLSQDLLPTIKRSWGYWGVAQFCNFWWISRLWGKEYQLLYVNLSFVLWTTYIAYVGYRKAT